MNYLIQVIFISNKHEFPYWEKSANSALTKPNLFKIKIRSNKDQSPNLGWKKCQPNFYQTSILEKNKSPGVRESRRLPYLP